MTGQEWTALAITGAALSWLVWRWRRGGLDDEGGGTGQGCGSCPKVGEPRGEEARRSRPASEAGRPEREPPARP